MAEVGLFAQLRRQVFGQRQGVGEPRLEGGVALAADEAVGILALRQKQKPQFAAVAQIRQRVLQRAPGGSAPGAIAVECEHHFAHQPEYPLEMLRRRCRAQRGDRVGDAELMQPHDVHVAFDDDEAPQSRARETNFVQAVEFLALVKQLGFRRIEVLGLARREQPAAEAQHAPARIADRKHDPVAEAVVPGFARGARRVALDDEPGGEQRAP